MHGHMIVKTVTKNTKREFVMVVSETPASFWDLLLCMPVETYSSL
jgi:hypothetical protein